MISSNAVLEINTKNLAHNFKLLAKIANKSLPGAIIKANAYGLGDREILNILFKEGCKHFFLATLEFWGCNNKQLFKFYTPIL